MSTSIEQQEDWLLESQKRHDALERTSGVLKVVAVLLLVAGVIAGIAFAWSAVSADVNLMGTETGSLEGAWDWWRTGWALAAGFFTWGVLYGLGELLSWASWDLGQRLPDRRFGDTGMWGSVGPATGQAK